MLDKAAASLRRDVEVVDARKERLRSEYVFKELQEPEPKIKNKSLGAVLPCEGDWLWHGIEIPASRRLYSIIPEDFEKLFKDIDENNLLTGLLGTGRAVFKNFNVYKPRPHVRSTLSTHPTALQGENPPKKIYLEDIYELVRNFCDKNPRYRILAELWKNNHCQTFVNHIHDILKVNGNEIPFPSG